MKKIISLMLAVVLNMVAFTAMADGETWSHITIAENAQLSDVKGNRYTSKLLKGETELDTDAILNALIPEGWTEEPKAEYSDDTSYRGVGGEQPWEYKHATLYAKNGELSYYNPMIVGERGGEYEAPAMKVLPEESIVTSKELLNGIIAPEWLEVQDPAQVAMMRWNSEANRWLNDAEYKELYENMSEHSFRFLNTTDEGLPIQSDMVMATIGANGLAGLTVQRHTWYPANETIEPLSLNEAIRMANSTRESDTVLYYAGLIYSNWLTENDEYNLCWQLCTSNGNYIVDCVLKKHMCDTYEY